MGRKKKIQHLEDHSQDQRERNFWDVLRMAEISAPVQFSDWGRFFTTKARYLNEAERWLSKMLSGHTHCPIEDDVAKGLMRNRPTGEAFQSYYNEWTWSCDESFEQEWRALAARPRQPKIPAPSGLSGVNMMMVF